MRRLRAFWLRVAGLLRVGRDDDFDAELESHLELHTEDEIRAGVSPEEARRQALIRLGGAEQVRQLHRERTTFPELESLLQDVRYGMRTLRRTPGFTLTAVFTLALGIGASTAIFSLVNAVLIRSLPYGDPKELVYLFTPNPHLKGVPPEVMCPSYADFFDLKQQSKSFANMSAFEQAEFTLAQQGATQRIGAARVDESFFPTLESIPELGRAIDASDNQPGREKVVVISHSLWQSMFAASPAVLGESLQLDGATYRIVGVMPPEFEYPFSSDLPYGNSHIKSTKLWIPLALPAKQKADREFGNDQVIARLEPGVTIRQAQTEMGGIMARLAPLHTTELSGGGALIESFLGVSVGPVRPLMRLLFAAVLLVLLIACGNAANLLLARASGRVRELGVRAALGAGRGRIMRQLLTESLLISVAGGAVGIALAYLFLRLLPRLDPGNIPRLNESSLDVRVLLFALSASLIASLLAGILPARSSSRLQITEVLKTHATRAHTAGHSRAQGALIIVQTAMVVVLLASAGLLIRSYINVESVNTGFSPSTLTMGIWLDPSYYQRPAAAHFKKIIETIQALPGVTVAGAVSNLPLTNSESLSFFLVEGFANQKDQLSESRSVTPGYFSAMQIPLIAGRTFTDADADASGSGTVIVNEQFAKTYFAGRNPLGAHISTDDQHKRWDAVIGVIADVRHTSLEEPSQPQIYTTGYDFDSASIAVRAVLPPATATTEIRTAVQRIDPKVVLADFHTMADLESLASARRRFQTSLLTVFAAVALLLAVVGLYGLMAYSVTRRTAELGIRMALGARRSQVLLLILKNASGLLGAGLLIGIGCAWIATRALQSFLFEVSGHDPLTIAAVCGLLALCGLAAAFVPAKRAASIDPMQALRTE